MMIAGLSGVSAANCLANTAERYARERREEPWWRTRGSRRDRLGAEYRPRPRPRSYDRLANREKSDVVPRPQAVPGNSDRPAVGASAGVGSEVRASDAAC